MIFLFGKAKSQERKIAIQFLDMLFLNAFKNFWLYNRIQKFNLVHVYWHYKISFLRQIQ